MASVLLSASVKRCFVSRIWDFFLPCPAPALPVQLPMPGCLPLIAVIAAILVNKLPGSKKLTCPENQYHIMRRLENWKHEDLTYQGYTYSLESNQVGGVLHYAKTLKYLDWDKAVITRIRFRMG